MCNEIELKLLKVIHSIVTTRSVTKTARILGVSNGTVSYMLGRARKATGSHLFSRHRYGMLADTTALELSQRYLSYLSGDVDIGKIAGHQRKQREKVRINTNSLLEMMMAKSLPGINSKSSPWCYGFGLYTPNTAERLNMLKNGIIDLDIGPKLPADESIQAVKLFSSKVSVLASKENRRYGRQLTLKQWYDSRHVIWSGTSDFYCDTIEDSAKATLHLRERKAGVLSGSIINTLAFCARTDYITLVPTVFADPLSKALPLRHLLPPTELRFSYDCFLHYNNQLESEPTVLKEVDAIVRNIQSRFPESPDHFNYNIQ
ncbi:LysR substrate-binding domain-containing protein [Scandinavium sp. NPDC088450]|uniref:LysR substrate-binding domain-containing protein n=1 Tax=Scandinavium sp. NPDC088450 TaxID=3364514 RepID=UPI00384A81F2